MILKHGCLLLLQDPCGHMLLPTLHSLRRHLSLDRELPLVHLFALTRICHGPFHKALDIGHDGMFPAGDALGAKIGDGKVAEGEVEGRESEVDADG